MELRYRGKDFKLDHFTKWLSDRGAQILTPTNEYEVIRFHANQVTSVVYRNKRGEITHFLNNAQHVYECFTMNRSWENENKNTEKKSKSFRDQLKETVLERDGCKCFYCDNHLLSEQQTLEHMVALVDGGPNHVSNLVLACAQCNSAVGSLSVSEKVKYRDEKRNATVYFGVDLGMQEYCSQYGFIKDKDDKIRIIPEPVHTTARTAGQAGEDSPCGQRVTGKITPGSLRVIE